MGIIGIEHFQSYSNSQRYPLNLLLNHDDEDIHIFNQKLLLLLITIYASCFILKHRISIYFLEIKKNTLENGQRIFEIFEKYFKYSP